MKKHIPYEKLQKKKQRELSASQRSGWGSLNPVTRRAANPKAYKRKKAAYWSDEPQLSAFFEFSV